MLVELLKCFDEQKMQKNDLKAKQMYQPEIV